MKTLKYLLRENPTLLLPLLLILAGGILFLHSLASESSPVETRAVDNTITATEPPSIPARKPSVPVTDEPTVTPTTTQTPQLSSTTDNNRKRVLVTRVIDGDTIEIEGGVKVRYIGIDTPETVHPEKSVECYGPEAMARNRELVEDKTVELEKDISTTDKYGRLLRYIWVTSERGETFMANEILVKEGYAFSSTYPPDVKYQERLLAAQREARENGRGLWSNCTGEQPASTVVPDSDQQGCDIKGNISYSTGEKIYHVPGCDSYEKTVINETKGERWFCSEEEAVSAGWRKAKNCPN